MFQFNLTLLPSNSVDKLLRGTPAPMPRTGLLWNLLTHYNIVMQSIYDWTSGRTPWAEINARAGLLWN